MTISQQATEVLKTQKVKTNDEYMFPCPNGGPISPDSVNNMLKRVLDRAGIPKVRFHDLRHSYAVAAIKSGDDIKTVQENLGHATAAFTLDVYGHITEKMKQESTARMEQFIKAVNKTPIREKIR